MKKIAFIILLAIGTNVFGQPIQKTGKYPAEFIPTGYVVFQEIRGDLNGDNQDDYVLIIKGTNKSNIVTNRFGELVDRNPRGIIVVFKNKNKYELILENRDCFSSENEDGGVYYAPELLVSVEKGNLRIHYAHGRYGYWTYTFRYKNSDFVLIGYDSSQARGPVIERSVSINLVTKKMQARVNINQDAKGGDEKFEGTWEKFVLSKPIKLKEIDYLDEFDVESFIRSNSPK